MPQVRIYRPSKNAMQSGRANEHSWLLEYEPTDRKSPDPLMGWNGSRDTRSQLRMRFPTKEAAVAYAEREGLTYSVAEDRPAKVVKPKNYADNFAFNRVG